jgi:uncharacterized protein (TIGR02757 family)
MRSDPNLKEHLDRLAASYDRRFLDTDPIRFVHAVKGPEDREVVGLLASGLAFGGIRQILRSVEAVLAALVGDSRLRGPHEAVLEFEPGRDAPRLERFRHRFVGGRDVAALLWILRTVYERHGSLRGLFLEGDRGGGETIRDALATFVDRLLSTDMRPLLRTKRIPPGARVRYLLPNPRDGSACKRLNLFLRWMVRRGDGIDFGIWGEVAPRRLVLPLDTHTSRISRHLGLTRRRTADWRMAEEVTANLRALDPDDPVRYDFALSRLGILDACPRRRDPQRCASCSLVPVCVSGRDGETRRRAAGPSSDRPARVGSSSRRTRGSR